MINWKEIDWAKIEEEATTKTSLPDSIPVNIREWENFRIQYELLRTKGVDHYYNLVKSGQIPYKKSLKEVTIHAYNLWQDFNQNADANIILEHTNGILCSNISIGIVPNYLGEWLESHRIYLKELYLNDLAKKCTVDELPETRQENDDWLYTFQMDWLNLINGGNV